MPKYLIKQVVEAVQWTEGPCPRCGNDELIAQGIQHKRGWKECSHCGMIVGSYRVIWSDGHKETILEQRFIRMADQLKEDYDSMGCAWCNGTGLNGGKDNLED